MKPSRYIVHNRMPVGFEHPNLQRLINRRVFSRYLVSSRQSVLLSSHCGSHEGRLIDLSENGARLALQARKLSLSEGMEIALKHETCPEMRGIVRWGSDGQLGVELGSGVCRLMHQLQLI
ncbi:PilZ domain-containing protein [Kiloniella sp. b19]|uniref:PilZ domain-containing protein n=1 Tax=Kiloniella sp. GXU_MW_B19 TaxID=3141326 RepID=UPI0031D0C9BC